MAKLVSCNAVPMWLLQVSWGGFEGTLTVHCCDCNRSYSVCERKQNPLRGGKKVAACNGSLSSRLLSVEFQLPQDFKDAKIVTIFKKGDRSQCGNYRGISLLSTAGKILAKVLLSRLQKAESKILPESQCGFRANRSTIDAIFTLRQLQEKSIEQQRPLFMVFIDFTKAFDTVNRELLWKLLDHFGCPNTFTKIIREFHEGMQATVLVDGDLKEPFPVCHGVKQGCILAPTLFWALPGCCPGSFL